MNTLVFVGNSLVHAQAIEMIRRNNKDVAITLVSSDGFLPYSRQVLLDFLGKQIKEKQIFAKPESFYKENKVRVITGQPVARINFKRGQVVLENKEQLSYDVLVLGDVAVPRLPEIKGVQRKGVYHAARLLDVREMIDQVPFAQTIVLQLNGLLGFLTLCALSRYSKEIVVSCGTEILPETLLDRESSGMLRQLLEIKGARLMMGNPIEEILGDSDLKAVKLKSGKVLSAEMVIVDSLRCDTRIFKDTGLELSGSGQGIRSNFNNVYWVDAVRKAYENGADNHYETLDVELKRQSQELAGAILREPIPVEEAEFVLKFAFKDLKGCWFGRTDARPEARECSRFYPEANVYKKFFVEQDRIAGGFVIGAESEFEQLIKVYQDKTNIHGMEEELLGGPVEEKTLVDVQQQG